LFLLLLTEFYFSVSLSNNCVQLYVTLDYESRFIGKEIINLFANRLGKSGTAICLFLITTQLEQDESKLEKFLTLGSNLVGVLWLCSSLSLTKLLRTKV
jgi:ATP/ADP translocase